MDTLPTSKEITRSEFESPTFNIQEFLVDHCQYRTLNDLKQLVSKWEQRLQSELQEIVNENYHDLVNSQQHLTGAKESLGSVKLEVLQFKAEVSKMARNVEMQNSKTKAEATREKELSDIEYKAKALLYFVASLDKLERLPRTLDTQQLVELSRAVVELQVTAQKYTDTGIVIENTQRLLNLKEDTLRRINDNLLNEPSLDVLMARARLYD